MPKQKTRKGKKSTHISKMRIGNRKNGNGAHSFSNNELLEQLHDPNNHKYKQKIVHVMNKRNI